MMKLCGISRSSAILGSDSPQSNNRKDHSLWVTPFIPRERPNVKHAIARYLTDMSNFQPLEVVDRGSETQPQGVENSNKLTWG